MLSAAAPELYKDKINPGLCCSVWEVTMLVTLCCFLLP